MKRKKGGKKKESESEASWRRAEREEGEMWEYVRNELFKA